jgi:hypothetical protein
MTVPAGPRGRSGERETPAFEALSLVPATGSRDLMERAGATSAKPPAYNPIVAGACYPIATQILVPDGWKARPFVQAEPAAQSASTTSPASSTQRRGQVGHRDRMAHLPLLPPSPIKQRRLKESKPANPGTSHNRTVTWISPPTRRSTARRGDSERLPSRARRGERRVEPEIPRDLKAGPVPRRSEPWQRNRQLVRLPVTPFPPARHCV